jgi:hypothetical protein
MALILASVALALVAVLLLAAWIAVAQPMRVPAARRPVPADLPARLEAHVRVLAEECAPRDPEHPENLARAADYVRDALRDAGGRVEEQTFMAGDAEYRNVAASFGPAGGERIVVGAHYDAVPGTPGADDNASAVAGLLELARQLGASPPAVRVDLVAFALEEAPFFATDEMGSTVYASALRRDGVPVRAMIALEMIGCFRDAPGTQHYPARILHLFYPSRGDFVMLVGTWNGRRLVRAVKRAMRGAAPLPVHALCAPPGLDGADQSDHRSFWRAGYPAVMVTDTAFLRNPAYHQETDTADTLDYRRMADVVVGVHAAVRALAGPSPAPAPAPVPALAAEAL